MTPITRGHPDYERILTLWKGQKDPLGNLPQQVLHGGKTYLAQQIDDIDAVFIEKGAEYFIDGATSFQHGA